ncbi:glycosyltransferase family 8 protein [Yoonia sp. 2307UL14-13]|uniref:glycosyltransferase family 8 protein n=1 Tax=Yoonia sp. 2307UL14-13 TaxID=3126506 RepID=UPI00309E30A7
MKAVLVHENRPPQHRNAVVFCCDAKYLPYAALAIHTLLRTTPDRAFDICIVSQERLEPPAAVANGDIRTCEVDVQSAFTGLPTSARFSHAAYLRIILAEVFEGVYDRILYLDCDTMVVGEDIGTIFSIDLHGAPVGAASDSLKLKRPGKSTFDQKNVGMTGSYFNSGVLLIDTGTFLDQQIKEKCIAQFDKYGSDKLYFDQTVLNLALQRNWACLDLAWNWQWSVVRPMFEMYVNVQIIHFISDQKPWTDPAGKLPAAYREVARRFLTTHYPDLEVKMGGYPRQLQVKKVISVVLKHLFKAPVFVRAYNKNGGDIRRALPPE